MSVAQHTIGNADNVNQHNNNCPLRDYRELFRPNPPPQAPSRQAKVDKLHSVALAVTKEDVIGIERTELGEGLVVSDTEEVVVYHILKADKEMAVTGGNG